MLARSLGIAAALTLTLAHAHAADLAGMVVDSEGKAVPGAKIVGLSKEPVVTDEKGAFSVVVTEERERNGFFVRVLAPGMAPKVLERVKREELQKIVLEKGVSESGIVVDAAGKPLSSIHVKILYLRNPANPNETLFGAFFEGFYEAITDAQGKWTISGIPAKVETFIGVNDPKYLVEAVGGPNKKLVAKPAGLATGRVLGVDGKPRGNVYVWLTSSRRYGRQEVKQTAADGTFTVGSLADGEWTVVVTVPEGDAVMEALKVVVAVGQTAPFGDLNLAAGVLVEGRVVEKGTGKGIPNVSVRSQGRHNPTSDTWNAGGQKNTDKDGKWSMRLLPGEAKILVQSSERRFRALANAPIALTVPDVERFQVPAIEVKAAPVVTARAVDEKGQPLAGVPLRISIDGYRTDSELLKTDASGLWSSESDDSSYVEEGRELTVRSGPEWEVVSPVSLALPLASAPVTVVLRPNKLGPLTGKVVSTTGKPVAGVRLEFTALKAGQSRYQGRTLPTVVTDESGGYKIPGVAASETISLWVSSSDAHLVTAGTLAGGSRKLSDTVVERQNATVRGRVVDAKGKPVSGVLVWGGTTHQGTRALTDAAGAFTLEKFPEEGGLLTAAKGSLAGTLRAAPGQTDAVVTLLPPPVRTPAQLALRSKQLVAEVRSLAAPAKKGRAAAWDCDLLANALAEADASLALAAGRDSGGAIAEEVAGGVVTVRSRIDPEGAAALLKSQIGSYANVYIRFYRATDVCEGFYRTRPDLARPWLTRALKESDGVDIEGVNMKLAPLCLVLGGPTTGALLTRLDREKKTVEAAALRIALEPSRAEEILGAVPEAERASALSGAVMLCGKVNAPSTAALARLLATKKAIGSDEYPIGAALTRAVQTIGPTDPVLALELAQKVPGYYKSTALALAAHVQADPKKKETLYRAVLGERNGGDRRSALILACEDVPAIREELRGEPEATEELAVGMAIADPALARWAAERSMYGGLDSVYLNPPEDAPFLRERAVFLLIALDPIAAMPVIEALDEPEARVAGKALIAGMLLLPREKRLALARSRVFSMP